jgi:hypothetical protein
MLFVQLCRQFLRKRRFAGAARSADQQDKPVSGRGMLGN